MSEEELITLFEYMDTTGFGKVGHDDVIEAIIKAN